MPCRIALRCEQAPSILFSEPAASSMDELLAVQRTDVQSMSSLTTVRTILASTPF
jgi:hypothetical protein